MSSLYERALGDDFERLHPKIRERYGVDADDGLARVGRGRTERIVRGVSSLPLLWAGARFDLCFPEALREAPFEVRTYAYRDGGRETLSVRRTFDVGRTRRLDTAAVWDDERERVVGFLGRGGRLVAELRPECDDGALRVTTGEQWLRRDGGYVRVPDPLVVRAETYHRYDEARERFRTRLTVRNSLVGTLFGYRGWFEETHKPVVNVPAAVKPTRPIPTLPGR